MGNRTRFLTLLLLLAASATLPLRAGLEGDSRPSADFGEVVDPDRQQGFTVRAETWGGVLPVGETKAIQHQLIKGNDYRFYLSTDVKGAKVSVNVYDGDGYLVGEESWQRPGEFLSFAGTNVRPKRTGSYYLMVKVEHSPLPRTGWNMVYAFK